MWCERLPAADIEAVGASFDETLFDMLRRKGAEVLKQAAATVTRAGILVDAALVEAAADVQVGECILRQAREYHAELIVCGTHGRRGVRRLLVGSDAEYIVRHASVPVLLVRPQEPAAGKKPAAAAAANAHPCPRKLAPRRASNQGDDQCIRKYWCPVRNNSEPSKLGLAEAIKLARALHARICLVHVVDISAVLASQVDAVSYDIVIDALRRAKDKMAAALAELDKRAQEEGVAGLDAAQVRAAFGSPRRQRSRRRRSRATRGVHGRGRRRRETCRHGQGETRAVAAARLRAGAEGGRGRRCARGGARCRCEEFHLRAGPREGAS